MLIGYYTSVAGASRHQFMEHLFATEGACFLAITDKLPYPWSMKRFYLEAIEVLISTRAYRTMEMPLYMQAEDAVSETSTSNE